MYLKNITMIIREEKSELLEILILCFSVVI